MKTDDFSFELPEELIAQYPSERRGESRLLVLERRSGLRKHLFVRDLPGLVEAGTLMVFNDSRVRKARIYGEALDNGSRTEFLLLRRLGQDRWEASCTKMKRQRLGRVYRFPEGLEAEIVGVLADGERDATRILQFSPALEEDWLERNGHIPLPPYIRREDVDMDADRYQTVYARVPGSAASPTAGLHFTTALLDELRSVGVKMATVTLHVGLGTFLPVRAEQIEDHLMHEEEYTVSQEAAAAVNDAKAEGRPILAVGTTSIRTLESAWRPADEAGPAGLRPGPGRTRIFIYPGYEWKLVDRVFTNFHTPKSTLLMLVAAFAGRELILETYAEAVEKRYRFFSYGDAMLIT